MGWSPSGFFHNIDNKDKAYWLGLFFADGNVEKRKVKLTFNMKDCWFLEKAYRTFNKFSTYFNEKRKQYSICLNSVEVVRDLISHGCVPRKSKIVELPIMDSRELYLAFLIGYFDGNGTQNKTSFTCGSLKFIEQIKETFNLIFTINKKISSGMIDGREISGVAYEMCLGTEIFNDMLVNYTDSLPRKRIHFCTNEERIELIKQNAWKGRHDKKFNIEKEDLERIVWDMPSTHIAKKYGVSDSLIAKRCKQLGIKKPPRGYWERIHVEDSSPKSTSNG